MDSSPVAWREATYEPDFMDVAFTPHCSYDSTTHVSKSLSEFDVSYQSGCCPTLLLLAATALWRWHYHSA